MSFTVYFFLFLLLLLLFMLFVLFCFVFSLLPVTHHLTLENLVGVGWESVESTDLPPMWPGFDSRTRSHMLVEFVFGSRPCSERFSPVLKNQHFHISNSTWKVSPISARY